MAFDWPHAEHHHSQAPTGIVHHCHYYFKELERDLHKGMEWVESKKHRVRGGGAFFVKTLLLRRDPIFRVTPFGSAKGARLRA